MDPDALNALKRVPHGGTSDHSVVDFSANTNPESPSGIAPVYEAALPASRRYPEDGYTEFRTAAGSSLGCDARKVIPTAGALAGIRLVCAIAVSAGDRVLLPEPSFSEYAREARLQGGRPEFVSHDTILEADPDEYALAIVCQPNNPTGEVYPRTELADFAARCRASETSLLVDEAFLDFTDRSSIGPEPGVVVARSLTKIFGLPGLRSGFLVATGEWREALETARPSWGLSTPAAAIGTHCLGQEDFLERTRERVAIERERMADRLATRFHVFPSDAPFLLFEVEVNDVDVDALIDDAREAGYVIRDARTFRTLDRHLRVAVRRPAENEGLLQALDV